MNANYIYIIYIAHRRYGVASLQRFVKSYCRFDAGIDHRLIIAFKDFRSEKDKREFSDILHDVDHLSVTVPKNGYDIGTYLYISSRFNSNLYCLLNSSAEIVADQWLAKLATAFTNPEIGLAGATGSFQSLAGYQRRFYRTDPLLGWLSWLKMNVRYLSALCRFGAYPNPHLRTNAILVPRAVLEKFHSRRIRTRRDATAFESGRRGLSRTVARMGLQNVIVDCNGRIYSESEWPKSATFWQSEQQALLVLDNRTEEYRKSGVEQRRWLRSCAWESP